MAAASCRRPCSFLGKAGRNAVQFLTQGRHWRCWKIDPKIIKNHQISIPKSLKIDQIGARAALGGVLGRPWGEVGAKMRKRRVQSGFPTPLHDFSRVSGIPQRSYFKRFWSLWGDVFSRSVFVPKKRESSPKSPCQPL